MARFLIAGFFGAAAADTVSSCGSASDHMKITSITTADSSGADSTKKGEPFTITMEGELDEAHQHGTVVGNLHLHALGIVDQNITVNQKYDFFPGLPQGSTKVAIGPFTFPRSVPGDVDFTGQIKIVDGNAEPVMCLNLDLHIPKILAEEVGQEAPAVCGDPSHDHITNIVTSTDSNNVTTTTMDLDESLDYLNVKVDVSVKVPVLPAVGFQVGALPISISPAIPAGQLKFVSYPSNNVAATAKAAIAVTGTVTLEDKNNDEVTCINLGDSAHDVVV